MLKTQRSHFFPSNSWWHPAMLPHGSLAGGRAVHSLPVLSAARPMSLLLGTRAQPPSAWAQHIWASPTTQSQGVLLGVSMKAVSPPPLLLYIWQERALHFSSWKARGSQKFCLALLAKALLESSWRCYCRSGADLWQQMPKKCITLVACCLHGRTPCCVLDCHM